MRKTSFLFIIILLITATPPTLFANSSGGELLLLDKGSRASALSGAVSASTETDAFGFIYNPATLGYQDKLLLGFEHNQWISEMQGEYLSTVYPLPKGVVGLALDYFSYGAMESINEQGFLNDQTFTPYMLGLKAAYGLEINKNYSLGVQVDYYLENIDAYADSGFGLSLGSLWQLPWKGVAIGLSIHHIGVTSSGYSLPGVVVLGFAWKDAFIKPLTIYLESHFSWVDSTSVINMAVEYQPLSWASLRLGYGQPFSKLLASQAGLTGGVGLKWQNWQLSYAIVPIGEFGLNHRFSLEYAMNLIAEKKPEKENNVPAQVKVIKTKDTKLAKQMENVIQKRMDLGIKQYHTGNYKMAIHEWKMVLDLVPNHVLAKEKIKKAEQEWKTRVEFYRQKARQAKVAQDLVTEIKFWKSALAILPGDQESELELKKAEQLAPALIQSLYNGGLDDYSKGKYKEAIQKWEKIIILNPQHYKALENIQKTKEKMIRIE